MTRTKYAVRVAAEYPDDLRLITLSAVEVVE